jgi:hypothetical protein
MPEHLEVVTGPIVTQTGMLTSGSPVITGLSTAAIAGAVGVTGNGIPFKTFVLSTDSATQVTLTQKATLSGQQPLSFQLEPITLAEAKLQLRLEIPDDDALVARLIDSARLRAQALLRQTLLTTTYDFFMDEFPAAAISYYNRWNRLMGPNPQWLPYGQAIIRIPAPPLVSVASIKCVDPVGNWVTLDPSIYIVATGNSSRIANVPGCIWPVIRWQPDAVVIQFTAGYATAAQVPESVKSACALMVASWYEHREEVADAQTYPVSNTVDALLSATDPGLYA